MQKLCYKYKAPFKMLIPNGRLEAMNRIQYSNASTLSLSLAPLFLQDEVYYLTHPGCTSHDAICLFPAYLIQGSKMFLSA